VLYSFRDFSGIFRNCLSRNGLFDRVSFFARRLTGVCQHIEISWRLALSERARRSIAPFWVGNGALRTISCGENAILKENNMAKIWPVYEGKEPTRGGPWAEVTLSEAITLLELRPADFVSEFEVTPRFGNQDHANLPGGFKHVIVELDPSEASPEKWKPGFYRSRVTPKEALDRLRQAGLR
jgi:hypothetical protein